MGKRETNEELRARVDVLHVLLEAALREILRIRPMRKRNLRLIDIGAHMESARTDLKIEETTAFLEAQQGYLRRMVRAEYNDRWPIIGWDFPPDRQPGDDSG